MKPKTSAGIPENYRYSNILENYLGGSLDKVFNGDAVYPRQLEIHLPGNHKTPCNFRCDHCQGRLLEKGLDAYEKKALKLVDDLEGRIPFIIYGGAYTEPLLNPYLGDFISLTKKHGSYFGIHTNGSLLEKVEGKNGLITKMCQVAVSPDDYLSVSLDAGSAESHMKTKNIKADFFGPIMRGIKMAVSARGNSSKPSVRVCYLLNEFNSSSAELGDIVETMKETGVDSLRFSIPYDRYGKDFSNVRQYKEEIEARYNEEFQKTLSPMLSVNGSDKPFVFYLPPDRQDVEKMDFGQCVYSYYQITLGADGYVYKCSSTASQSFAFNRLGKVPDNRKDMERMIMSNHDPEFRPVKCFEAGARCNRIALEINLKWKGMHGND